MEDKKKRLADIIEDIRIYFRKIGIRVRNIDTYTEIDDDCIPSISINIDGDLMI